MNIIGVDYGIGNDIAMYSVMRKVDDSFELIDSGKVEDFDYAKYLASEHQIVGEKEDLEKFQVFLKKGELLK